MSQEVTQEWLSFYLRDHLAGARAGVNMFGRVARGHSHPEVRTEMARIRIEVEKEYQELHAIMSKLGIRQRSGTMFMTVFGELAGRLKPNGSFLKRTVGADVLELEALASAVQAKARLWETLLAVSEANPALDAEQLHRLQRQAEDQRKNIIKLHTQVVHSPPTV